MRRTAAGLGLALVGAGLLLAQTLVARRDADLGHLRTPRRYWEDVAVAATAQLSRPGAPRVSVGTWRGQQLIDRLQHQITRRARRLRLQPWQALRTVPLRRPAGLLRLQGRAADDPGRAELLRLGFALVGGVAPYLGLWLGPALGAAVLAWAIVELSASGRPRAAAAFGLLVGLFPFFAELLSLPYSAVGFYLVALLGVAATGAYAALAPRPSPAGLALRLLAAGVLLALCALCRSGSLLLLPGYALAAIAGVRRLSPARLDWRLGSLAALALLLSPYLLLHPARHRQPWVGAWEGLGDFDRTHGHAFFDPVARAALRAEGVRASGRSGVGFENPENDRVFRRLVVRHVREDPLWYAGILGRRVVATVLQTRLWPWGPWGGQSMELRTAPNEGNINVYYRMTTRVDWLGLGAARVELPVPLLLLPTAALLALLAAGRLARGSSPRAESWRATGARLAGPAVLLACVALASLVQPVLITTASALEPQCFALVFLLGAALLAEEAAAWRRGPLAARSGQ